MQSLKKRKTGALTPLQPPRKGFNSDMFLRPQFLTSFRPHVQVGIFLPGAQRESRGNRKRVPKCCKSFRNMLDSTTPLLWYLATTRNEQFILGKPDKEQAVAPLDQGTHEGT